MESAAALAGDRAAPERETTKKVIVIGDGHVGKTCFVSKITQNKFITNYHATVGVEYGTRLFKRPGKDSIRLCLWDIAGQERFRSLMPQFARNSAASIIMCDVSRRDTMEGSRVWKECVDKTVLLPNGGTVPSILLINKCDLPKGKKTITSDEMADFAQANGFVAHFETSVKEGLNINECLECVVEAIGATENGAGVSYGDYSSEPCTRSNCCSRSSLYGH